MRNNELYLIGIPFFSYLDKVTTHALLAGLSFMLEGN